MQSRIEKLVGSCRLAQRRHWACDSLVHGIQRSASAYEYQCRRSWDRVAQEYASNTYEHVRGEVSSSAAVVSVVRRCITTLASSAIDVRLSALSLMCTIAKRRSQSA